MGKERTVYKPRTARDAKEQGMAWVRLTVSGGPSTAMLGALTVSVNGPVDADAAFLVYCLVNGHSLDEARARLAVARQTWERKLEAKRPKPNAKRAKLT